MDNPVEEKVEQKIDGVTAIGLSIISAILNNVKLNNSEMSDISSTLYTIGVILAAIFCLMFTITLWLQVNVVYYIIGFGLPAAIVFTLSQINKKENK